MVCALQGACWNRVYSSPLPLLLKQLVTLPHFPALLTSNLHCPAPAPPAPQVRPPVEHQWGCTSPAVHTGPPHAPVSVFRHRLLQLFQLSIFCKLPVLPISTLEDLR